MRPLMWFRPRTRFLIGCGVLALLTTLLLLSTRSSNFSDNYKLGDVLQGKPEANPYLEAGDIVTLPEADQVYVVGNVFMPLTIPLREPVTLTRAIAMAGGLFTVPLYAILQHESEPSHRSRVIAANNSSSGR